MELFFKFQAQDWKKGTSSEEYGVCNIGENHKTKGRAEEWN
jgi:hypothetical protein